MATTNVIKEANVIISIKGLALSHYKEKKNQWETRFLRHVTGHKLKLTVKKNGTEIFSDEIDQNERISIITGKAKEIPSHYNEGNNNDLNHLVDFNSNQMCGTRFKFKNTTMTLLSISNACFYTKTLSRKPYTVRKNGKKLFTRRVGLITGGDIVSLDKTEIIYTKSSDKNLTLPAESEVVYEVIFDNDCPKPPQDGSCDFDRFSDVIELEDKYTLTAPEVLGYMDPGEDDEDDKEKDPPCTSGLGGELDVS